MFQSSRMSFPQVFASFMTDKTRNSIELRRAPPLKASSVAFSHSFFSTAMLRIRKVSGEELIVAWEEDLVPDVRALKRHLHRLQDLPPRFRQRLLLNGQCLEDKFTVHAAMELELVVLPLITKLSSHAVQEFKAAAFGHFNKARALSKA